MAVINQKNDEDLKDFDKVYQGYRQGRGLSG
jgi:hypothetical protein